MAKNVGREVEAFPRLYFYIITNKRNVYPELLIVSALIRLNEVEVNSAVTTQAVEYIERYADLLHPNEGFAATLLFQIPDCEDPAILLIEHPGGERLYYIVSLK